MDRIGKAIDRFVKLMRDWPGPSPEQAAPLPTLDSPVRRPYVPLLETTPSTFTQLNLERNLLDAVEEAGFEEPTSIQTEAIPKIIEGRDVIGSSQTGTGKTAAFALPILQRLGKHGKLRCLILEPTRELAVQVDDHFQTLGKHTDLKSLLIYGGVGYGPQIDGLKSGVDIVTATPGRLLDLMKQKKINLSTIEFLVLDEVDRMLDIGFMDDVRRVVQQCPEKRQTLFFSATVPPQVERLASWALNNPYKIAVGRESITAETVSHYFYPVSIKQRDDLLKAILVKTDFHSVMIFTRTKAEADRLAADLKRHPDYRVTVLHSDIPQNKRARALRGFKEGNFDIIVATDLAARGLDISGVTHVINYRVPENPEDYVHRIGRTGRARREGDAYTILSADELPFAEAVEKFIEQKIERRKLDDFDYIYTTMIDDDAPNDQTLNKMLGRRSRKPRFRKRRR